MLSRIKKIFTEGRLYLGGSHLTLLLISYVFFELQRSMFQILSAFIAAIIVEFFCRQFSEKNRNRTMLDSLMSAFTEAAGFLILVRSRETWFYVIGVSIAVLSKYLLTTHDRKHIYNPTNIAIVICLAFLPSTFFDVRPDEFDVSLYAIFHVICFGSLAVYFGKTWRVSLGYFSGLVILSLLLSYLKHEPFIYYFGPEVGAIGMIYMFLMITDPKTTPKTAKLQLLFGFAVSCVLYTLRYYELIYANYFALFIISLSRGLLLFLKSLEPEKKIA